MKVINLSERWYERSNAVIGQWYDETAKPEEVIGIIADLSKTDKMVIDFYPNLKLIASCTTGLDHIDTEYCKSKGIKIISLQGETDFLQDVWATAEHTMALILSLVRRIPFAHNDVCKGNWNRESFQGSELHGGTLGIIGYGRVGQQVAKFAEAFGMKVIWCDPYIKKPEFNQVNYSDFSNERVREILRRRARGIDFDKLSNKHKDEMRFLVYQQEVFMVKDLEDNYRRENENRKNIEELLKESDIITVHVPLDESTRNMFGIEQFKLMKPSAYFINTSRGSVVDEFALLNALTVNKIAGAAIDVATGEPKIWEQLRIYAKAQNNLIITPHIAGNTVESREKTQIFIANRIKEYVKNGNQ